MKKNIIKLVVIIPAFNEERTIADVITSIPNNIKGIHKIHIVVIDDGSTDKTKTAAESVGAHVLSHSFNKGVGAAFHTGIKAALIEGADIIVNIDADGQFSPRDIPILIQPIIDGKADFVTASRFKEPSMIPHMPKIKKWGNKRVAWLISYLAGQKFYDVSCGFRAYSRDTALRLNLFGSFTYTQETLLDLAFKNANIMEIPMVVKGEREFGESKVASNLWKYARSILIIIFRSFRDYKPLKFFGLLSLPFFGLGMLLEAFLIIHYIVTGNFSPHKWAGFAGMGLFFLGLISFIIGLVADMLDRIRLNQEELLFFERKKEYKKNNSK